MNQDTERRRVRRAEFSIFELHGKVGQGGPMTAIDPLICERCSRPLESDDAISVIEGVCGICRNSAQSLVQPFRADEILKKGTGGGFLDDLPTLNEPPAKKLPWLVEEHDGDDHFVEVAGTSSSAISSDFGDDDFYNDEREAVEDDEPIFFEEIPTSRREPEPFIPPGPYSESARKAARSKTPDLDEISEIFSPESVPPSEMPVADHDSFDDESKVDIHRFNPPPVSFENYQAPRRKSRGSAIRVGVLLGVVLVAGLGTYGFVFSNWGSRLEQFIQRSTPQMATVPPTATEKSINLRIDPPHAEVFLDGFPIGEADQNGLFALTPQDVTDGRELEIRALGYHTIQREISDLRGSDEATIRLTRMPYEATVSSTPAGADIWLDGELVGQTPTTISVPPESTGMVSLKKDGFETVKQWLVPPDAESDEVAKIDLALSPAGFRLVVATEPLPAEVWIDSRFMGMAPLDENLPYTMLGKSVEIVARASGFDDARLTLETPEKGGEELEANLVLVRTLARVNVRTEPPGGRIVVGGRDYGFAPTMVEFDPSQSGRIVVVDASSEGEFFGRQSITVPPPGAPHEFMIPMERSSQRVVFVFASNRAAGADRFLLIDDLASRIEQLDEAHRFAIVAASDEGVDAWPYEVAFETASSEQKIRAFDMVRSIRTADEVDFDQLMNAAAQLDPTVVWVVTSVAPDRGAFESFAKNFPDDKRVTINVIKSRSLEDETWLDGFVARHGGVFQSLEDGTVAISQPVD